MATVRWKHAKGQVTLKCNTRLWHNYESTRGLDPPSRWLFRWADERWPCYRVGVFYHYLQFGGKHCLKVKGLTPSATNSTRSIFLWEPREAGQGQVASQPLGDLLGGVYSSGACSSLLTPPLPSLTSPHPKQGLICSLRKWGAWTCLLLLFNYFHSHLNFHYSFHYLLLKSIYSIYTCTYMDMYLNYKFFNIYSTYTLNRHIYTYRKWIHK